MGRDMPCGQCTVCDEPVDHSELGVCSNCGGSFHWNECGGWVGNQQFCIDCEEADEEEGNDNDQ